MRIRRVKGSNARVEHQIHNSRLSERKGDMVAQRLELAVMVSAEELQHLKNAIDERIDVRRQAMCASPDRKQRVALADDIRVATMLRAKLDVSLFAGVGSNPKT